jgi:hypothetical protein
MKGDGVIVLRLENNQQYFEHETLAAARTEAHRLARTVGGSFVVYVPVGIVESTPPTQERVVEIPDARFDDLPF